LHPVTFVPPGEYSYTELSVEDEGEVERVITEGGLRQERLREWEEW